MKKKSSVNNFVTKTQLKTELKVFKKELKKELNVDFDKRFDIAEQVLREEIRQSVAESEQRLSEQLSAATDKILTHIDPFVKEVRDSHDEREVVADQISKLRDRVDLHDEKFEQLKHSG
jgi:hypothetical protein